MKPTPILYIVLIIFPHVTKSTIDMNMNELQYLADHLHPEECRRLFASVHFNSYEQPNALGQAESQVSKDIPCIRLLLHWNSEVGEGKGETHEVIEHRLRQMGNYELADWLGKTVFHQLSQDLKNSLNDPFHELATDRENSDFTATFKTTTVDVDDITQWIPLDTIFTAAIIVLVVVTLAILFRVILMVGCKKNKKKKKIRFTNKKRYKELENWNSETDSDEVFDVRVQNRDALNLMGVTHPKT